MKEKVEELAAWEKRDVVRRMTLAGKKLMWWQLRCNPAKSYECLKLELSEAWELGNSLRPLPLSEGKETPFGFSYGDQNE